MSEWRDSWVGYGKNVTISIEENRQRSWNWSHKTWISSQRFATGELGGWGRLLPHWGVTAKQGAWAKQISGLFSNCLILWIERQDIIMSYLGVALPLSENSSLGTASGLHFVYQSVLSVLIAWNVGKGSVNDYKIFHGRAGSYIPSASFVSFPALSVNNPSMNTFNCIWAV